MAKVKTPAKQRRSVKIWAVVVAVVTVLAVVLNILMGVFKGYVETFLGTGTWNVKNSAQAKDWDTEYYKSDYSSQDEALDASDKLVQDIVAEGVVLLKNTDNALPLGEKPKVTLLGSGAADSIYGGSGSGMTSTPPKNMFDSFTEAGIEANKTVYDLIKGYTETNPRGQLDLRDPSKNSYAIGEMPAANYTQDAVATFSDYSDAGVVVISRVAGEGGDLTTDMNGQDDNYVEGQHQLELNKDEKDLIALAKQNFDKVVVLVNMSTSFELGELQNDEGIDAIAQIGSPGQSGMISVGKVLTGEVNPSGRTTDIFAADFTKDPTFVNFGNFDYANTKNLPMKDAGGHFVDYAEGIYMGYRYYETASEEGFINYDDAVVYPFGYGMSYTNFKWELESSNLPSDTKGDIEAKVKVTNTGDVKGKDVVEAYYTAPYTKGGIEKSHVVLGDFAKTKELAPGESETVTLTIPVEDMASYDYENAKAYVLEQGDYQIKLQKDSHNMAEGIAPITYSVAQTVVYGADNPRSSDDEAATNEFDDVSAKFSDTPAQGKVVNMSRADFAGTFPKAPSEDLFTAPEEVVKNMQAFDHAAAAEAYTGEAPTLGANGNLGLIDLRGKAWDDPMWDELLDQLTAQDMSNVLLDGAYKTNAIVGITKPATVDPDGPAGFSSFMNPDKIYGTAFMSEYTLAQTWNVDLGHQMGLAIGNEAFWLKDLVSGWYAPAVNTHRSPFAGRNFEYYSEDGTLAGKMAAQVLSATQEKGVYSYIKHFALNDQETNREQNGVATWANEQTIREIYLKPFEVALKNTSSEVKYIADDQGTVKTTEVGPLAVMSSFNRIGDTWAGGSKPLMNNVLRGEWGFRGMVITDFNLFEYMYPEQGMEAGSDLMLTIAPMKQFVDGKSAWSLSVQRNAMHNILYTVANSSAMNNVAPGAEMKYHMATWEIVRIIVDVILVGLLAFVVYRLVRRWKNADKLAEAPVSQTS